MNYPDMRQHILEEFAEVAGSRYPVDLKPGRGFYLLRTKATGVSAMPAFQKAQCKAVIDSQGRTWPSIGAAARALGCAISQIQRVAAGHKKTVHGLSFRYASTGT